MSSDETIVLPGSFTPAGRTVPTGNGWTWISAAWSIFRAAVGTWIGMAVVLALIFIVFAVVPVLGPIASIVLGPVFTAGLVMASRTAAQGGDMQFAQLFAGFKHRFGTLAAVGGLYLAGTAVIMLMVSLITGVGVFSIMSTGNDSPEALARMGVTLAIALLLMVALMLPLLMAVWFAAPLVVFNDLRAVDSMKASFVGCLKNVLPFLFYGLVLLIAAVIACIPFMLGWLILGPVMAASIYTAYQDIYFTDSAA